MITITAVWLYLITHVVYSTTTITVNNNGSSDCCCKECNCPCNSLSSALHYVQDHTVINITSKVVSLNDIVEMGSDIFINLNNITIIGNNATIMCNNTGGVYCESCSNITIVGITWYQCGRNDSMHPITQTPALNFTTVSNVTIQKCIFLSSSGCPVYINNAKESITITESYFVNNTFNRAQYSYCCAGLYIYYTKTNFNVLIISSGFYGNGCRNTSWCFHYGVIILGNELVKTFIETTEFSNNSRGLYLDNIGLVQLSNVNVYNNTVHGIYIIITTSTEANFIMSFVNLTKNVNPLSITTSSHLRKRNIAIDISNSIIKNNTANYIDDATKHGVLRIVLMSAETSVIISNSHFYNNFNGAVGIHVAPSVSECELYSSSISFTNVSIYNTTTTNDIYAAIASVSIVTFNIFRITTKFTNVNFTSNNYLRYYGEVLHIENSKVGDPSCFNVLIPIELTHCTFDNNTAFDYVLLLNIDTTTNFGYRNMKISNCNFEDNFGGKGIVYIQDPINLVDTNPVITELDNSTFSNNKGTALHLLISRLYLLGTILFMNNTANSGAAIYFEEVHSILGYGDLLFIDNSAIHRGGALYFNLVTDYCNVFTKPFSATFINNSAKIAGNAIYFSIPHSCKIITHTNDKSSFLYVPNKFNYSQPNQTTFLPVVTSPYNIKLYPPAIAVHNSSNDYVIHQYKMLGEPIQFNASVFDYFNNITEPVIFIISCITCGNDYVLSTYQITIQYQSLYELKVFPTIPDDVINNTNISITMLAVLSYIYKSISASLTIELSSCHTGYMFDKSQRQCICYPHPDVVHCNGDHSEIKIGYWIGFLKEHYTSSICPSNYCNFGKRKETNLGYYDLPSTPDGQCNSHRTGVACGECKPGYTLAYDSPDCINTDKCSAGMTVLVIVLTILYWIAIVAVVFGLMYFLQLQISSGYAYGIIYYYSIVDILLVNYISEEVTYVVSILSSFAKLTPQLFGQLCLVKGLSGIDQQFIHYSHALAVSLILLIIVLVTRYSPRLAMFVSRCIIHIVCLLLLLSYTSLASTSLQLLRPLTFNDVDEVRTYSSPDIKYFTGRHLAYAIVAIFCEVIIVIGLPLLLLLEPLLNRKINFVKIKPLLDQFQGCYKDKYRWFAAYYLICRQVIILIVYVGNGDYYNMIYGLQTGCVIIAMIHGWLQPYKNNLLNGLDEIILLILVLVVNLNLFPFLSFISTNISLVLVVLPLLLVCFIAIRKLLIHCCARKRRVLNLYNPVEACDENEENDNYNNERR